MKPAGISDDDDDDARRARSPLTSFLSFEWRRGSGRRPAREVGILSLCSQEHKLSKAESGNSLTGRWGSREPHRFLAMGRES